MALGNILHGAVNFLVANIAVVVLGALCFLFVAGLGRIQADYGDLVAAFCLPHVIFTFVHASDISHKMHLTKRIYAVSSVAFILASFGLLYAVDGPMPSEQFVLFFVLGMLLSITLVAKVNEPRKGDTLICDSCGRAFGTVAAYNKHVLPVPKCNAVAAPPAAPAAAPAPDAAGVE